VTLLAAVGVDETDPVSAGPCDCPRRPVCLVRLEPRDDPGTAVEVERAPRSERLVGGVLVPALDAAARLGDDLVAETGHVS
jgi:hypothetical protein